MGNLRQFHLIYHPNQVTLRVRDTNQIGHQDNHFKPERSWASQEVWSPYYAQWDSRDDQRVLNRRNDLKLCSKISFCHCLHVYFSFTQNHLNLDSTEHSCSFSCSNTTYMVTSYKYKGSSLEGKHKPPDINEIGFYTSENFSKLKRRSAMPMVLFVCKAHISHKTHSIL